MKQDYYAIPAKDFQLHSPIQFNFVDTHADLCNVVAREMVDLVKANRAKGKMTVVILPVGPLHYYPFAELCNREGVSCESLVIISMDEYCDASGHPIPIEHPLSFRAFYKHDLLDRLDADKRLPPDQLILPDPQDLGRIPQAISKYGGVDVVYGGMGINGHFAFNSPPIVETDVETFRNTTVRLVQPREGDVSQMAMGATGGNVEMIPPKACTVGMRELLSAKLMHLTFMRTWHAGVLRRALFGPVAASFPGSLVQTHPNVKATITSAAAPLPLLSILQRPEE